jgi:hypothetical protein
VKLLDLGGVMKKGDLVKVNRGLYYHYGLALDEVNIINYRGEHDDSILQPELVKIIISPLDDFLLGGSLEIEEVEEKGRDKSVETALSFLGESKFFGQNYDVINNNCEHFARYCVTGENVSYQSDTLVEKASLIIESLSSQFKNQEIIDKLKQSITTHVNKKNSNN